MSNPSASREVTFQAWQLRDFLNTGHHFSKLVDETTRQVINHLTKETFRTVRVASSIIITARDKRAARSRSSPIDPLAELQQTWLEDWAIDRATFRAATTQQQRLFDPPSTGNTPDRTKTPTGNPQAPPSISQDLATGTEEVIC